MSTDDKHGGASGGPLKRSGLVGPALERLEQQVRREFRESLEEIVNDPDSPRGALARRVASPEDLQSLADDPPQDLVAVLGPVLCPMLNWVRMFDPQRIRKGKKGWEPTESFERGQRALLNGWYEDAVEAFKQTVERDNPEDFVSLFGLGQLYIYWEGDPEAALPLLERAARYAVPMNAQAWMKRFAAESFLACADLHVQLEGDYDLALKQLDNAEQLTEPRPEIDLARAKIAAKAGRQQEVSPAIRRAVASEWLYAVQVALDPEFPPEIFEQVIDALDGERERVREEAAARAEAARAKASAALEGVDLEYGSSAVKDAARKVQGRVAKLDEASTGPAASLLKDLAQAEKVEELAAEVEQAADEFIVAQETVEQEIKRASVGEKMLELQTQKDEVDKRLMMLVDALASGEKRLEEEKKQTLERAQKEIIREGIMRLVWLVAPVFILVLFYQYTTLTFSPSFSIEFGKGATVAPAADGAPAGQPAGDAAPSALDRDMDLDEPISMAPMDGPVLAQNMSPDELAALQERQEASGAGGGVTGPSYHQTLDGWIWFLFVVYVLGIAGLTAKNQWEALQERERAIERTFEQERESLDKDIAKKQLPLEERQRELSRQINELREQM